MQKPLASIAVLTYQAAPYIEDCIKGILSQTYPNIELLILDDASMDKTQCIIDSYMDRLRQKCVQVEFVKHSVNSGNIPHNCNELIKKCKGDYIKLCGGDDVLSPHFIEEMVEFLEENKDCEVAYCNGYVVPDSWHPGRSGKYSQFFDCNYEHPAEGLFERLLYGNLIKAEAIIYRKSVFEKYGYYDETLLYEDWDMWLRLTINNVQVCYVDKHLVYYRTSKTGITRNRTRKMWIKKWNQRVHILDKYRPFIDKEKYESLKLYYITKFLKDAERDKYYDLAFIMWRRKRKYLKRTGKRGSICKS